MNRSDRSRPESLDIGPEGLAHGRRVSWATWVVVVVVADRVQPAPVPDPAV